MRRRERPAGTVLVEAPPPELRTFGSAAAVHGSREAWLAGRNAWAAQHGLTVREWWDALVVQVRESAQSLDELNEPFGEWFIEDDDECDPRVA